MKFFTYHYNRYFYIAYRSEYIITHLNVQHINNEVTELIYYAIWVKQDFPSKLYLKLTN